MKTLRQVENELEEMLEKFFPAKKLSVAIVKQWVYEESGPPLEAVHKFQNRFFECFSEAETGITDLNEVLQTINDAWNYFPHKILGGKSPNRIRNEH